jgi:diguanylate cyclase (GGDEF)-like protein
MRLPLPSLNSYARLNESHDDGPLPDLVSGLMWLTTGITAVLVLWLPGTVRPHAGWLVGLAGTAIGWGCISLVLGRRGKTMPLATRAAVTASVMPVFALGLWATGGADSYLQPVLLFTALFIAYFFPPRLAWPLVALFIAAFATPLLYDPEAISAAFPARVVMFAVTVIGEAIALQFLKERLLRAEARQRRMAERDPLTGLLNRRSFDAALERVAMDVPSTLIIFDFNNFKQINDVHGHPVGDEVLRAVAAAAERVVREGDCLARIGGDEFAVIAHGAGHSGALRLIGDLDIAIRRAEMPAGVGSAHAAFGWAVAPDDGPDASALLVRADQRLLERKRERRGAAATAD